MVGECYAIVWPLLTIVVDPPGTLEVLRAYVNLQKLNLRMCCQLTGRKSLSASRTFLALFFLTIFYGDILDEAITALAFGI